jgi:ATP-dependent Lon protease
MRKKVKHLDELNELVDHLENRYRLQPDHHYGIFMPEKRVVQTQPAQTEEDVDFVFTDEDVAEFEAAAEQRQQRITPKKKRASPLQRRISVFKPAQTEDIKKFLVGKNRETQKRLEESIKLAQKNGGYRLLPLFRGLDKKLAQLCEPFANFDAVLEHYRQEFLLAKASKPAGFCITPVLLNGPPGVGKTAFAQEVARLIGLSFHKISAGGMQHAAALTGTSSHWGNSETGEVFNLLARGEWASGVLLIDEADKLTNRSEYAILPALLDLLEPESARRYTDESLGLSFDASRLIVLMTSNSVAKMDSALLSRLKIFNIKKPEKAQRRLIAMAAHDKLNSQLVGRNRKKLDMDAVEVLSGADIDTRMLIHAVKQGFMQALERGNKVSSPVLIDSKKQASQQIGFVHDAISQTRH